jgi:hypothetical protein
VAITVDGQPLSTQVFGGVDVIAFAGIVDATRRRYEAQGWDERCRKVGGAARI